MTRRFVTQAPDVPLTRDTLVRGPDKMGYPVPVRIYHPDPDHDLPAMIFAHGGGHMAGSVSLYNLIARKLAAAGGRILISVDYRLSPECPYPSALTDIKNVIRHLFPTLERLGIAHTQQLAVAGDSGGAAITASAVHQIAEEEGVRIDQQLLVYPSLDYTMSSESMETLGKGYLLERERVGWLFDQYFQHDEDRRQASPLFMPLPANYPKTLVVTAGFCPLRDVGFAYVDRLTGAGIDVENLHFPNMIHAFLNLEDLVKDECGEFYRAAGEFLRVG
jgi:acetyl esterase/lipase